LTLFWENVAPLVNPDVQKPDQLDGIGMSTNYAYGDEFSRNLALLSKTTRILTTKFIKNALMPDSILNPCQPP
jgi:hypothetical protein